MGIRQPILPGGHFPLLDSPAVLSPDVVLNLPPRRNHPSFCDLQGLAAPPGHSVVQGHVQQGFGLLFRDRAAAVKYFEGPVTPAPLGCISKAKDDGSVKHRVILDLKANQVNLACTTPERQVLPTYFQHAKDIAELSRFLLEDSSSSSSSSSPPVLFNMILDMQDAFMNVPLHAEEQVFNACGTERLLHRLRPPLYAGEPSDGRFVVWAVLGFGGKSNPLIFARAASFAIRTAQGLLRPSPSSPGSRSAAVTRLQCYVDDPIATMVGSPSSCVHACDLIILWWLVLGIPLAFKKGTWTSNIHRWIGADFSFSPSAPMECMVTVPDSFVDDLFSRLGPLAKGFGHLPFSELDVILGKAGRLAYLIPAARPWVSALWGAWSGAQAAAKADVREAPPGRAACRRFSRAALWIRTLLHPPAALPHGLLPLHQRVLVDLPPVSLSGPRVLFDASPWGGGAVLFLKTEPVEYITWTWNEMISEKLGETIGDSAGQSTWEFLVLFMALCVWGSEYNDPGLALIGDNLASLQVAVNNKGKGSLNVISRELAWRKVRYAWRFATGHLPTELNKLADSLSRLSAPGPERKQLPVSLASVPARTLDFSTLWFC